MVSSEESLKYLQKSLTELPVSQLKVEDLPHILRQLDLCLQKSNDNVMELKDSLKFVLDREASLKEDYDSLVAKLDVFSAQGEVQREEIKQEHERRLAEAKAQLRSQEIESIQREAAKQTEYDAELADLHLKYINELSKRQGIEAEGGRSRQETDKLRQELEKMKKELAAYQEALHLWKEKGAR
jgi:chromosome segregation ATPase